MNKFTKSTVLAGMLGASTIALTMAMSTTAFAQSTTGQITGSVTTDAGVPISGATVTILNKSNGSARTLTSNSNGSFAARNLSVGGLYDISVNSNGYQGERVENIALSISGASNLSFALTSATTDEIIVVAQRTVLAEVAPGPNVVFSLDELQNSPAINRDIKDIIRLDPRVYVDESFNDAIQCAGANPRFNSLTVDGIRLNDNFGLNSNGYPTERIPFSFDAINQVAVELAPMDVEYGGFTACNINAVTKSGTNEITGGAFFDYTTRSLKGGQAKDLEVSNDGFEEYRYGIHAGGPIIKDRLFVFGAYEKLKGSNLFGANTPAGTDILQAEYDEIIDIATTQYGYVSGGLPATQDNFDEKLLLKVDAVLTDNHRASLTYNYNDGNNISGSDTGSTRLADGNHFYERGARLHSFSGSLYSDWSDVLSTEIRGSYIDLDNRQNPVAGTEFGEIQVRVPRQSGGSTTVYLGADDSRHANQLNYELFTIKAKFDLALGNHLLTGGIEHESFDVFNQFIQEVEGEWVFNSIDDFRNGDFSDFRYENAAGTNNPDDGAAQFGFSMSSIYFQDKIQATDRLELTAGLRIDSISSDDVPAFNQNFFNDYGIRNDSNLDGKKVVQPRLSFNYDVSDHMVLRGGVGLFSGGNPNVWVSNNYSNNGVTLFEYRVRGGNLNDFTYPNSGNPFFEVPQEGIDAVTNAAGRGPVNAIDPDFKLPSEWKFTLGTSFELNTGSMLGDGYNVNLDLLYSKTQEAAIIRNLELTQTDTAPDGRPIYSGAPFNDFLLTNARDKGDSLSLSAAISKSYDNGIDWRLGYAYTNANDVNPMTSSVAFSNDKNYTTSDPLNPGLSTTNYEVPHRFTGALNYKKEFFADLETRFSLFGTVSSGRPFSYVYSRNGVFEGFYSNSRQLFYVPDGANDPNVTYAAGFDQTAFFNFINSNGLDEYAGQIAPRNAFNDKWWPKFDLKIKQEFPGFRKGDRASGFIVLENVLNFVDSDWGVLEQHAFPNTAELVSVAYDSNTNQYTYSNFNTTADQGGIHAGASTWEIRFGLNYDF